MPTYHMHTRFHGPFPSLPTGREDLNRLLRGGYPRNAATVLAGAPQEVITALLYMTLAHAQQRGETVGYINSGVAFDAMMARRHHLLSTEVVHATVPYQCDHDWVIAEMLERGVTAMVWAGLAPERLPAPLPVFFESVRARLRESDCALLLPFPHFLFPAPVMKLYFTHAGWCYRAREILGYRVRVRADTGQRHLWRKEALLTFMYRSWL